MKKILLTLLIILSFLFLTVLDTSAAELSEVYSQVYETAYSSTSDLLTQSGLNGVDFNELISISPKKIFTVLFGLIVGKIDSPFKICARMLAVMIGFSVLNSFNTNKLRNEDYFNFAENAVILVILFPSLCAAVTSAVSSISTVCNFMFVYIPVFTALLSASGRPVSSACYSSSVLGFAELCNLFSVKIVLPAVAVVTSVNIYSGLNSNLDVSKISSMVKKLITVTLSIIATVFVGLTNLKTTLAGSADSLTLKGVKMASGSFIPIIGSPLGEAVSSAIGALSLIRSTVGAFGIVVIILVFLPPLVELLIWYAVLSICSLFARALELKTCSDMLDGITSAVSVVNVLLVFCALVFVLTTGNLLKMSD